MGPPTKRTQKRGRRRSSRAGTGDLPRWRRWSLRRPRRTSSSSGRNPSKTAAVASGAAFGLRKISRERGRRHLTYGCAKPAIPRVRPSTNFTASGRPRGSNFCQGKSEKNSGKRLARSVVEKVWSASSQKRSRCQKLTSSATRRQENTSRCRYTRYRGMTPPTSNEIAMISRSTPFLAWSTGSLESLYILSLEGKKNMRESLQFENTIVLICNVFENMFTTM
jgi:hypothetical protein